MRADNLDASNPDDWNGLGDAVFTDPVRDGDEVATMGMARDGGVAALRAWTGVEQPDALPLLDALEMLSLDW